MLNAAKHLSLKPEADTEAVEDLITRVRRGLMRIPRFQRGLRWDSKDVISLFDSVYNGYPIGSFLLRKGSAEAARIDIGPLKISAPETSSALWVVDGQQRLTALTAGLSRDLPIPATPDDPYVIYFDAAKQVFEAPPKSGEIPDTWVPVANLLDASELSEWVFTWKHANNAQLRGAVFQAGTRLRQYRIPLYVVETDNEELLKDIFYRINNAGKSLSWTDVHDAIFGHTSEYPSTLPALATELQLLGMGRPDEKQLLSCLLAFRGLDVTRNVSEHYRRDPDVLRNVVIDALPALRSVLAFLKSRAEIPHLRLLPRSIPFVILTRFFHLFPDPNERTQQLLTRWVWRTLLARTFFDERTLLRHGVAVIEGNPEDSTQRLLSLVPSNFPSEFLYNTPKRFDARAAESRFALLGMASMEPLSLDGKRIDVAELVEERDVAAFRTIIPNSSEITHSPANRILLPGSGLARRELISLERSPDTAVLQSHGISVRAFDALQRDQFSEFIVAREFAIEAAVQRLGDRLAAWSRNDRPSIHHVLNSVSGVSDARL